MLNVLRVAQTPTYPEVVGFGTVKALRQWSATAEVRGRVVVIHPNLRSGNVVEAGEVLVKIDPADYELRVNQRAAELAQAKAQRGQLQLDVTSDEKSLEIQTQLLDVRERDVERLRELRTRSAASQSEFDQAIATYYQQSQTVQNLRNALATYPTQIASAEAVVAVAESKLREAERELDRTTIVAPFRGVLSEVSLEPRQYVATSEVLFQVLDIGAVEIEAQFSIAQLGRVASGSEASRTSGLGEIQDGGSMADQYPDLSKENESLLERLQAEIAVRSGDVVMRYAAEPIRISESLNEETRTLGIVVRVSNRSVGFRDRPFALRPGTYCEVILSSSVPTNAVLIPRSSVDADSVLVVDQTSLLSRREIKVGFTNREQVAVIDGLVDDDLVVVNPPAEA
ncbi:MAG: HlyD family efflux transporter periplasmic adaptor subunit, partial [Planctomycetota bacterium]